MGILNKVRSKPAVPTAGTDAELSKEEIKFILTKLRSADYKGQEFETFYHVYTKLQDHLEKDNQQ